MDQQPSSQFCYEACIIQEGYCTPQDDGSFLADCSITLLKGRNNTHNILVDTGGPKDAQLITEGLHKLGLKPENITHVIGTHGHSDHIGNLNLFPHALVIVSHDISRGNVYFDHNFKEGPYKLDDGVEVFSTPGHTGSDVSVLVAESNYGRLVVAGDLFESEGDLENASLWRDVSENPTIQAENRCKVIDMCDYIIPGHGKGFTLTDRHRQLCHQQKIDITQGKS